MSYKSVWYMLHTLFVMGEIGLCEDRNLSRPLLIKVRMHTHN
nr:MAG TPA: hypothetical protein [Caudoviricetes sp.]